MHYILEIIIPNGTKDIPAVIAEIMKPFDENAEEPENPFWDFYSIGGRFAGQKLIHTFDQNKLEEFYRILRDNNVTVSSVQCGKQEISPPDQIPFVDAEWNKLFPENDGRPCPLFKHSNDPYDKFGIICGDIMPVSECRDFECGHMIIATLHEYPKTLHSKWKADYMLQTSLWNGVIHQETIWDGKIGTGVDMFLERIKTYAEPYRKQFELIEKWLSVTIDYHS